MEEFPHLKNKKSKKRPFKKKKKKKKNKANPGFELPPIPTKPRFSRETTQFKTVKTPKRKLEMKPNSADQLDSTEKKTIFWKGTPGGRSINLSRYVGFFL